MFGSFRENIMETKEKIMVTVYTCSGCQKRYTVKALSLALFTCPSCLDPMDRSAAEVLCDDSVAEEE